MRHMSTLSSLSCTVPRLEAALEGEPPSSQCPHCLDPVFGPGWWCEMILDADHEPEPIECEGDEEPDDDFG